MSDKQRLDALLVQRGYFDDLHAARAAIMAGDVVVGKGQHRAQFAGERIDVATPLRIKASSRASSRFVSRGGYKLEKAFDEFALSVEGLNCADLGASSGGFTDCLLQRGAAHVSAIDVGYGQFDMSLRNDARVRLFERTNVRGCDVLAVGGPFDVVVADLSFISQKAVMEDVTRLLCAGGFYVSLIKPQFEVAKSAVGKGGIVEDASLHELAIKDVLASGVACGLSCNALTFSPITGRKGNREFLVCLKKSAANAACSGSIDEEAIQRVVMRAHLELGA